MSLELIIDKVENLAAATEKQKFPATKIKRLLAQVKSIRRRENYTHANIQKLVTTARAILKSTASTRYKSRVNQALLESSKLVVYLLEEYNFKFYLTNKASINQKLYTLFKESHKASAKSKYHQTPHWHKLSRHFSTAFGTFLGNQLYQVHLDTKDDPAKRIFSWMSEWYNEWQAIIQSLPTTERKVEKQILDNLLGKKTIQNKNNDLLDIHVKLQQCNGVCILPLDQINDHKIFMGECAGYSYEFIRTLLTSGKAYNIRVFDKANRFIGDKQRFPFMPVLPTRKNKDLNHIVSLNKNIHFFQQNELKVEQDGVMYKNMLVQACAVYSNSYYNTSTHATSTFKHIFKNKPEAGYMIALDGPPNHAIAIAKKHGIFFFLDSNLGCFAFKKMDELISWSSFALAKRYPQGLFKTFSIYDVKIDQPKHLSIDHPLTFSRSSLVFDPSNLLPHYKTGTLNTIRRWFDSLRGIKDDIDGHVSAAQREAFTTQSISEMKKRMQQSVKQLQHLNVDTSMLDSDRKTAKSLLALSALDLAIPTDGQITTSEQQVAKGKVKKTL